MAYAVISPPRRSRVLLVTPGNEPLRLALQTKEAAEIADVRIESPELPEDKALCRAGGGRGLATGDLRPLPAGADARSATRFRSAACRRRAAGRRGKTVGSPQIIDVEASHPLLQWIDLGDVLVAEATPLKVPRGGSVLVDSDAGPLLALAPRDAFEDAVLGFVILDEAAEPGGAAKRYMGTNWLIRPSFPVFVLNLLDIWAGAGTCWRPAACGRARPWSLGRRPAGPGGRCRFARPAGQTVEAAARAGKVAFADTGELGVYEVQSGGKTVRRFAVNLFDPAESAIRPDPAPAIKIGDVKVTGESGWEAGRREIWKYLVVAGLVVLLLEWYIYIRRIY